MQLSLVEAGEGRIGSTMDRVLLFCFHYDANSGSYAPAAVNLMKFGGFATVFAVVLFLLPWRRMFLRTRGPQKPVWPEPVSESLT